MTIPKQTREPFFELAVSDAAKNGRPRMAGAATVLHDELRFSAELLQSAIGGYDPDSVLRVHELLMQRTAERQ